MAIRSVLLHPDSDCRFSRYHDPRSGAFITFTKRSRMAKEHTPRSNHSAPTCSPEGGNCPPAATGASARRSDGTTIAQHFGAVTARRQSRAPSRRPAQPGSRGDLSASPARAAQTRAGWRILSALAARTTASRIGWGLISAFAFFAADALAGCGKTPDKWRSQSADIRKAQCF